MNQDLEHLRLLSIFHYVVAGLTALVACFPVIYLVFGLFMIFNPEMFTKNNPQDEEVIRIMGPIMAVLAGCFILAGWTLAVCIFLAGRNLVHRRRYTFCLVIAGIMCMFMPFGTVLGLFTIIVLVRPSVKELFENNAGQVPRT